MASQTAAILPETENLNPAPFDPQSEEIIGLLKTVEPEPTLVDRAGLAWFATSPLHSDKKP